MSAKWYVELKEEEVGPLTSGQLKRMAEAGKVRPDTMLRRDDISRSLPARKVKGLFADVDKLASSQPEKGELVEEAYCPTGSPSSPAITKRTGRPDTDEYPIGPSDVESSDRQEVETCPACGSSLQPDAALCIGCGYDLRTGTFLHVTREHEPHITSRARSRLIVVGAVVGTLSILVFAVVGAVLLMSDGADESLVMEFEGEYSVQFRYIWQDINGRPSPAREITTSAPCVHVTHSWRGWSIEFFSEKWSGKTDDLLQNGIECPLARTACAFPDDGGLSDAFRAGRVNLCAVDGALQIRSSDLPTARAPVPPHEEVYVQSYDSFGRPGGSRFKDLRRNYDDVPANAIIKSTSERKDSLGTVKLITATIPGTPGVAGFREFSCSLLRERGSSEDDTSRE